MTNLSPQALLIRNFVSSHYDFNSVKEFISSVESLDEQSIVILKKTILAGYWTSYYSFNWTSNQEIDFWELILKKNPNSSIAILTLAESYRGNKLKKLKEVIDLYFKAIEINLEHYFSLTMDEFESNEFTDLRKDIALNKRCLDIEFQIYENHWHWTKEEYLEELPNIIKRCNGNKELEEFVMKMIDSKIS